MKKSKKINKKMTFAELIKEDPEAAMKLASRGMFCGGCPMAMMETIEQGAEAHGVDADELIEDLKYKNNKEMALEQFCPKCGSNNIKVSAGIEGGQNSSCGDCGFDSRGNFPEREVAKKIKTKNKK